MIISKEAKIGALFFVAIAVFLVFAVAVGALPTSKQYQMVVYFDRVFGLQPGNDVWMNGISIGTVKNVETVECADENGKSAMMVRVALSLSQKVTLHEGYEVNVVDKSFIAGRAVDILAGPPDSPPHEGTIYGKSEWTMAAIQLRISQALTKMTASQGTMDRVIQDPRLYDDSLKAVQQSLVTLAQATKTLEEMQKALAVLTDKDSTYTRIMTDPKFAENLTQAAAQLNNAVTQIGDFVGKMNEPGSFANRLVTDRTLFPRLEAVTIALEVFSKRLSEGKGIGRAFTDEALYRNIQEIVLELRRTTAQASKFVAELEKDPQMLVTGRRSANESWLVKQLRPAAATQPASPADSRKLVPED